MRRFPNSRRKIPLLPVGRRPHVPFLKDPFLPFPDSPGHENGDALLTPIRAPHLPQASSLRFHTLLHVRPDPLIRWLQLCPPHHPPLEYRDVP